MESKSKHMGTSQPSQIHRTQQLSSRSNDSGNISSRRRSTGRQNFQRPSQQPYQNMDNSSFESQRSLKTIEIEKQLLMQQKLDLKIKQKQILLEQLNQQVNKEVDIKQMIPFQKYPVYENKQKDKRGINLSKEQFQNKINFTKYIPNNSTNTASVQSMKAINYNNQIKEEMQLGTESAYSDTDRIFNPSFNNASEDENLKIAQKNFDILNKQMILKNREVLEQYLNDKQIDHSTNKNTRNWKSKFETDISKPKRVRVQSRNQNVQTQQNQTKMLIEPYNNLEPVKQKQSEQKRSSTSTRRPLQPQNQQHRRYRSTSRKEVKKMHNSSQNLNKCLSQRNYLIKTVRYNKDGKKVKEQNTVQSEEPKEFSDHTTSMKMLDSYRSQSSMSGVSDEEISQKGFLSQLLNPKNIQDLQTIQTGPNRENVYINTQNRKKKRIVVIKKTRNKDGSTSTIRQNIFRDFGVNHAIQDSQRLKQTLHVHCGDDSTLRQINQSGVKVLPDGTHLLNLKHQLVRPNNFCNLGIENSQAEAKEVKVRARAGSNLKKGKSQKIMDSYDDGNTNKKFRTRKKLNLILKQKKPEEKKTENENLQNEKIKKNSPKISEEQKSIINKYGYQFQIPKQNPIIYRKFLEDLIFNPQCTESLMQPIPPEVGMIKFAIVRNKSMLNKLSPCYYLYLEKSDNGKILVMYGKKIAFKKQSYYLISTTQNQNNRESEECLGKLRAIEPKQKMSTFVLYDNGQNYNRKGVAFRELRKEHGAFIFRYDPCNDGNIRKMFILFPSIQKIPLKDIKEGIESENVFNLNPPGERKNASFYSQLYHMAKIVDQGNCPESDSVYTNVEWRPTHAKNTMISTYQQDLQEKHIQKVDEGKKKDPLYKSFIDNPPIWNAKSGRYVYDFKGRVTEASIKNFQLIPEHDPDSKVPQAQNDFILQFGRRGRDEFILDVQFPLSIFQGFGLALSAFDTE